MQSKAYLPKLLEYIEVANKVPHKTIWQDQGFPDWQSVLAYTKKRLKKSKFDDNEILKSYKELLADLPPEMLDFVFGLSVKEVHVSEVKERVDLIISAKQVFLYIAMSVSAEKYEGDINQLLSEFCEYSPGLSVPFIYSLKVNDQGFLELVANEVFQFLALNKIEARRIRLCDNCEKIFWAYRLDKWTCDKKCGNILRQKRWQEVNKEEYNENRRRNYAYKKSIKKQKEDKSDGTI